MKKNLLILIILLISKVSFCQIRSVIVDSETKQRIPYVNIWIKNENIGTTSNENGEFSFKNSSGEFLILSSLGYENKRIEISKISNIIFLNPKVTKLNEVIIKSKKMKTEIVVGKFDDSDVDYYYGSLDKPEIYARFYPFDSNYSKAPYLKKLKFRIYSNIRNAKFNVRLYSFGDNGKPKNLLCEQNIIGTVKKGTKNIELDISDLNITFPENGLFVSYESLIIEKNQFKVLIPNKNSKKRVEKILYEPNIGFLPSESDENSWVYKNGNWQKVNIIDKKSNNPKEYINKFGLLAIEITLTD